MTRHALFTELRRSVALPTLMVVAVIGTVALFNETEQWAGRWSGLATYLRTALIVLAPIALAAGAWHGGRERRQRIGDLLASVARPVWQQVVLRWGVVTLGAAGGVVAVWVICAILLAPVAVYSGGGWWWLSTVGLVAVAAVVAVGVAIGQMMPWRVTAPVLGLAGYVVIGVLSYADDGRAWLSPAIDGYGGARYLPVSFHALQAVWFAALAAAVLALAGARRRWVAVAPAAVAAVAGTAIALGPAHDRWVEDSAALVPVCADDIPEVCTTREMSFVLDDFVVATGDVRARLDGVDGAPRWIEGTEFDSAPIPRGDGVSLPLAPYVDWRGGLSPTDPWGFRLRDQLAAAVLPATHECAGWPATDERWAVSQVARLWAGGTRDGIGALPGEYAAYRRLTERSGAEQERWIEHYITAVRDCDAGALDELVDELR